MESPERVIVTCTDDVIAAHQRMQELSLEGKKRAGFAQIRHMIDPPKTVFKYCVFYFKE
jgi:hypothetical protein